jgi:6-phosphofructokinase 1
LHILSCTPSAALGSCRLKLGDYHKDDTQCRRIFELFEKYRIGYFFYIGGNDSMDTVAKLSGYAGEHGIPVRFMGVPKTIDNDLVCTDHTPGYGSAAKYVAVTMQEIIRDCTVHNVPSVTIVEIMGRDAGWLTAAAELGRLWGVPTPDLVYLPELIFDMDRFIAKVDELLSRKKGVVIALSEGIRFEDGEYVGASGGEVDSFGHKRLTGAARVLGNAVKERFGCRTRSVELGILQRCSSHVASRTDLDESFRIGYEAVRMALEGQTGRMAAFVRNQKGPYGVRIDSVDVTQVVNKAKAVDARYLNPSGEGVADELLEYIKPLIQGEVDLPRVEGMPVHFQI